MKVLHLSSMDIEGGAARGAFWLHKALLRTGVDSQMLVDKARSTDPTIVAPRGQMAQVMRGLRARIDPLPLAYYRKTDDSFWTLGWVPSGISQRVRRIAPDIVHIHWTGVGFLPVDALKRLPYPVVWTLRDMWAFTGGCHYTAQCNRYRTGCGTCPQLRSERQNDVSRWNWQRKERHWRDVDIWLVPISSWLASCARASPLFEHRHIEVIPNGLDVDRFRPFHKAMARRALGIAPDRMVILYGAVKATDDPRKGFGHLCRAIRALTANGWGERVELLVFGGGEPTTAPELGMATRYLGHQDNDEKLALLYSAADIMVAPSLQEAFGKTLIEAMACGTPVVAFAAGGPTDIVDHRTTGYLARPFDAKDLGDGIAWCLEDRLRLARLGRRSRKRVESEFDINVVARRYSDLYAQVLENAA